MNPDFDHVILLADESADWEIAGLRQLERLVLALDELATSISSQRKIDIFIFWRPDIVAQKRWRPQNPRLSRCAFVDALTVGGRDRVFNTRLLVKRPGLEEFVHDSVPLENDATIGDEFAVWEKLWQRFQNACVDAVPRKSEGWRYIDDESDVARAEGWLLRGSGKSRDGFISRYLNRGFVIGALLFNVHSILDGCDGEIARAKYLDSEKGPGVDAIGDLIALLLFSIGLGFGLFRSPQQNAVGQWVFLTEGVLASVFITLRLGPDHVLDLLRRGPAAVVFTKDDERLRRSGGQFFGDRLTSLGFELAKRDVAFFVFLIAIALGLARWILHLLFIYALTTWILSRRGRAGPEKMS